MFQAFQFPFPVTPEIPSSLWPGSPPLPLPLALARPWSRPNSQLVLLVLQHEDEDITALRIHVLPLTCRLQIQRSQQIKVFICRKSEVIQKWLGCDQSYLKRQTPKLFTASPQVLITAGTPIITCISRNLHVFTTCALRGCPQAIQNFFATYDVVPIFPRVLPRL